MELYERIKQAANDCGTSINQLEKDLGFPRSSISKFNKNTPSADKIYMIAKHLNVSADWLIGGKDNSEPTYYLNEETAEVAQEIFENKELRALFDVQRDMSAEDLRALHNMALALKRKETGSSDNAGC